MPPLSPVVCLVIEPDGPPMDVILQPVTSQSIRVTWKVMHFKHLSPDQLCLILFYDSFFRLTYFSS